MITSNKEKRIKRVRAKIFGTKARPRLAVYRSNRQISVQLIDDEKSTTLAAATSADIKKKMTGLEKAVQVGESIAQKAIELKIKEAVFDRRGYQYHGQVKALADAARAKGLRI